MAITTSGTSITFNDSTTQTTAWTGTSGAVTSAVAGNGVAVSGATGAVTFSASCPTAYSVGSYALACMSIYQLSTINIVNGTNYSTAKQCWLQSTYQGVTDSDVLTGQSGLGGGGTPTALSGTWKWMAMSTGTQYNSVIGVMCRVS